MHFLLFSIFPLHTSVFPRSEGEIEELQFLSKFILFLFLYTMVCKLPSTQFDLKKAFHLLATHNKSCYDSCIIAAHSQS